jgi:hypothetical protein
MENYKKFMSTESEENSKIIKIFRMEVDIKKPFNNMWVLITVNIFSQIMSLVETLIFYTRNKCNFSIVYFFII